MINIKQFPKLPPKYINCNFVTQGGFNRKNHASNTLNRALDNRFVGSTLQDFSQKNLSIISVKKKIVCYLTCINMTTH